MIDKMIGVLRQEAQDDIAHRDVCEGKLNANKNAKEDAEHEITKAEDDLSRLKQAIERKRSEVKAASEKMDKTKSSMADMTTQRNKETDDFRKALKDDADAVKLLEEATAALSRFYKSNKFLQAQSMNITSFAAVKPAPKAKVGEYKGEK